METINFSIEIKAQPSVVWEKLWSDETYPVWTAPFDEGSHAKSDWKEGSKILFLGSDGNGMVSIVDVVRPYEMMAFKHIGTYKNGEEDTESESVKEWAGATETYELSETEENTTYLHVDVQVAASDRPYMEKKFPESLVILKDLAESEND